MVNGKPHISDGATLAQMEREEEARRMEEACGMFLSAERRFQKIDAHPDKVSDVAVNLAWWESLEQVYERERVVWRLFVFAAFRTRWSFAQSASRKASAPHCSRARLTSAKFMGGWADRETMAKC